MTARTFVATVLPAVAFAIGCNTHEERFEKGAPPRQADRATLRNISTALVTRPRAEIEGLAPEELAALVRAATAHFEASSAPGMRQLLRRYADALLGAQVTIPPEGIGFYGRGRPSAVSQVTTLRAGLALLDCYRVTREPRYRRAIRGVARGVTSPAFGWTQTRTGYVIRSGGSRRPSVALSALAAAFLHRAARLGTGTRLQADGALGAIESAQAAVGRWYAFIGSKTPMTLEQWATTLGALTEIDDDTARGILGAGVPALASAAFAANGALREGPYTENRVAVGSTMRVFANYPDERPGRPALFKILESARRDGTVALAKAGDVYAQAMFADALSSEFRRASRT